MDCFKLLFIIIIIIIIVEKWSKTYQNRLPLSFVSLLFVVCGLPLEELDLSHEPILII